jgi:kumamolisin
MDERKVFKDSVTELPAQPGPTVHGLMVTQAKTETRNEKMELLFSLEMPSLQDLEKRVAAGEIVTRDELGQKYAPKKSDLETLKSWLTSQGFEVTGESPNGTGLYARATVEQIENSLAVNMVRVTKDGITYTAARNAPSLPLSVAGPVHAIIGLQPFRQARKHNARMLMRQNRSLLDRSGQPSPNAANTPPYLVSEIRKAYNADAINVTGKGQTIAILIDTFPDDEDLIAFWNANGLPTDLNRIEQVNVNGGALPPPSGEETLDASWSSGMAPGAKIKIYASGTLQFVALDKALDQIIADAANNPSLRQLSISLGLGETFMGGPQGEVATQHQKFLQLAAAGVNVFVSSGDAGSNPDDTGQSPTGPLQVEYEASDPAVIGVGGTSLTLNTADGSVAEEDGWTASGGGDSIFFDRPQWQQGAGVPDGTRRCVPDVSIVADPNTGAFLVLHGQPVGYGGTSWSAPVWAAICALINEARQNVSLPALPFLNPMIYPLLGSPCFRDVQSGSNGQYTAGPGYDRVTGVGVPNIAQLIAALSGGQKPVAVAA